MLGSNYDSDYPNDSHGYDTSSLPFVPYAASSQSTEPISPVEPYLHAQYLSAPDALTQDVPMGQYAAVSTFQPVAGQFTAPSETEILPVVQQKESRRGLWIALISIFALLVIGSASAFALVSYINRSTPMKTLDIFCNALQKEDYQIAYNQFSKQLQTQFTEGDFAGILSQEKVTSCRHGSIGEGGDHGSTSLTLVHGSQGINNDKVVMKKGTDNVWKIDDLQGA